MAEVSVFPNPERPWMQNRITWQAYWVTKINQECLTKGQYPNGQKLKQKDIEECQWQIDRGLEILAEYGISIEEPKQQGQLQLF